MTIQVYLIRHGVSEVNIKNPEIIGGRHLNAQLTSNGVKQSTLIGNRFKKENINFDKIYTSPAVRAIKTAEIICNAIDYDSNKIKIIKALIEMSYGSCEGKLKSEVFDTLEKKRKYYENPDYKIASDAESYAECTDRAYNWLQKEIKSLIKDNKNYKICIVSHSKVLTGIYQKCLNHNLEYRRNVENFLNGSITRLDFLKNAIGGLYWREQFKNDYSHLNGTSNSEDNLIDFNS